MNLVVRLACVLVILASVNAAADEFAPAAPGAAPVPSWWSASIGYGGASDSYDRDIMADAALLAAISAQNGPHIITARYTYLGNWRDDGDVALLYERAFSRRRWLVSGGFGLGLRHATTLGPVYTKASRGSSDGSLGLAWTLQAVTRKHANLGLGLIAYGSVNSDTSLLGLGAVVHIGRLEQAGREGGGGR